MYLGLAPELTANEIKNVERDLKRMFRDVVFDSIDFGFSCSGLLVRESELNEYIQKQDDKLMLIE